MRRCSIRSNKKKRLPLLQPLFFCDYKQAASVGGAKGIRPKAQPQGKRTTPLRSATLFRPHLSGAMRRRSIRSNKKGKVLLPFLFLLRFCLVNV